jgi:hypothetical protein
VDRRGQAVALGFIPLLAVLVAIGVYRRDGRRPALLAPAMLLLGAAVVLAPWIVNASRNSGYFVPVTDAGPSALLIGSDLAVDGSLLRFNRTYGHDALDRIAARHPAEPRSVAFQTEARRNLRRYAIGQPLDFAAMMVRKAGRMWHGGAGTARGLGRGYTKVVHLVLLIPMIAALTWGIVRTRNFVLIAIAALILYTTLVNAIFIPTPRHNLPLMPLVILGGISAIALVRRQYIRNRPAQSVRASTT